MKIHVHSMVGTSVLLLSLLGDFLPTYIGDFSSILTSPILYNSDNLKYWRFVVVWTGISRASKNTYLMLHTLASFDQI